MGQGIGSRGGDTVDSGYISKVEPIGFVDGSDAGLRQRTKSRRTYQDKAMLVVS